MSYLPAYNVIRTNWSVCLEDKQTRGYTPAQTVNLVGENPGALVMLKAQIAKQISSPRALVMLNRAIRIY